MNSDYSEKIRGKNNEDGNHGVWKEQALRRTRRPRDTQKGRETAVMF